MFRRLLREKDLRMKKSFIRQNETHGFLRVLQLLVKAKRATILGFVFRFPPMLKILVRFLPAVVFYL